MTIGPFDLTGNARVKTNDHFYVVTWKVGTMCISAAILFTYANTEQEEGIISYSYAQKGSKTNKQQ